MKSVACLALCLAVALAAGCSQSTPPAANGPTADGAKYLLAAEPAGAKPVKELRGTAQDGDEVVVVVRGRAKRDDQGNLTVLAAGIHRRPAAAKPEAKRP